MKYDVYKDYASRSKFAITFGEGLDGYYTETVYSGGISFAVYNEIFFTKEFENLHSLYKSFDELLKKIVSDIKYFENEENYNRYNDIQNTILSKMPFLGCFIFTTLNDGFSVASTFTSEYGSTIS